MRTLLSLDVPRTALLVALGVFVTFAATAGGTFLSAGNMGNVARQISLDAPLVFGSMIVLIAGGIDISVGATMAMAAALAIGLQPYGTGVAVAGSLGFGLAMGLLNGLLVVKARIVPFVATLGTMSLSRGLVLTYTHQQPLSGTDEAFAWWGGGDIGPLPVPLLVTLGLLLVLSAWLGGTKAGRNLYAIGGSREAAYLAGIPVARYEILAYVLSGGLAAVSGVLLASRLNSASVQLGNDTPLLAISAALIGGASLLGGRGRLTGAFFGVLALGMLGNGMNLMGTHTYVQIAVRAAILIAVVALDALGQSFARRRELTARAHA